MRGGGGGLWLICVIVAENRERPYNPLDRVNLAHSVERALLERPLTPLPPPTQFAGAGLYAIYYHGDFPAYAPITPPRREKGEVPIYVGRAIPKGARAGVGSLLSTTTEPVLYRRLAEHARSIQQAENLRLDDFSCRYLVVDDIWIPLAEALLIMHYKPVWNRVLQGFGNHDPGSGRRPGARPDWDEVHPGRPWAAKHTKPGRSREESLRLIEQHFASFEPPDLGRSHSVATDVARAMMGDERDDDGHSGDTSPLFDRV